MLKNLRCKRYRITEAQKERIKLFLLEFYTTSPIEVFIGGSQSIYSKKYPTKNSDIDLYIFNNTRYKAGVKGDIIWEDSSLQQDISLCLGYKINIFQVNNIYKASTIIGMEKLI